MHPLIKELVDKAEHAVNIHDTERLRALVEESDDLLTRLEGRDALILCGERERWIGVRESIIGDLPAALVAFEKALVFYTDAEDDHGISRALGNIGITNANMGNFVEALSCYHSALDRSEKSSDLATMAIVCGNIGIVHSNTGDQEVALQWYHRALSIHQERKDHVGIARLKGNIGVIYGRRAEYPEALRWLFESLDMHEASKNRVSSSIVMGSIGHVYQAIGDYASAIDWYMRSLAIEEEIGNTHGIAVLTGNIGTIHGSVGDIDESIIWLQRARDFHDAHGNKLGVAAARGNIAHALMESGNRDEAEVEIRAVLEDAAALQLWPLHARMHISLIRLLLEKGSIDEARTLVGLIPDIAWTVPTTAITARMAMSMFAVLDNNPVLAEAELMNALEVARIHGIKEREASIHKELRSLYRKLGRFEESINHADQFELINDELRGEQHRRRVSTLVVERTMSDERKQAEKQRLLLFNVLPEPIARRILEGELHVAEDYAEAAVMFIDVVGFTSVSKNMQTAEVLTMLNELFTSFDAIADEYHITKVKTIGDAWMGVSNAPSPLDRHHSAIAMAACEMMKAAGGIPIRIGLHSGPISSGVIGTVRRTWDIWGDTVNVASRMESTSESGKIHVSSSFALALKGEMAKRRDGNADVKWSRHAVTLHNAVTLHERGTIEIKGKGLMKTFWLVAR
ncbi:MAG: tetratricopeptide repeat protein [Candidatus Kapabacteria bacterium]|nr:tetratricopeptide repeat protein [Candidatus Kapabacteria bacterium]